MREVALQLDQSRHRTSPRATAKQMRARLLPWPRSRLKGRRNLPPRRPFPLKTPCMPVIVYRLQPWAFVDKLVFDPCPPPFEIVPMARDASPDERARLLHDADFLMGSWVTTTVTLTE